MKFKNVFIVAVFVSSLIFGSFIGTVEAADIDIVQQYAPIFYFEKDETCFPVDVSYHIDNSYLYQFTEDEVVLITETPSVDGLDQNSTNEYLYLDNQRGSIDDDGIINDYQGKESLLGYKVYSRVYSSGGTTVVQYWMFYAFNKGSLNIHEGDWEMVQVILFDGQPTEVMYSQHHGGQKAAWSQVERAGDHIKVYVAQGTHANYLRSYSGVIGAASDVVGANGKVLSIDDYSLELLDPQEQDWLNYAGGWGVYGGVEDEIRGRVGPQGPMYRENSIMWDDPVGWGGGLPQADNMVFMLEWFLYNFVTLFIMFTTILLLFTAFFIYRRHKRYGLGPRILSILYIDGFNLKSIGNIFCFLGVIVAILGLFSPWYGVAVDIDIPEHGTTGMVDMIVIDGVNGIRINLLDDSGSLAQIGSIAIPFSLLIIVGLVFLFIGTIGISTSKKLGKKYVYRGIKLAFVIIMILIVIMSLGVFASMTGLGESADATVSEIFSSLSSQPFGGDKTIPLHVEGVDSASLDLQWGLELGGQLLLVAGLIIVIAGVLLFVANTTFFEQKHFEKSKKGKKEKLVKAETEKVEQETEDVKENEDVERSGAEPSEEEKNESLESTEGKT